MAFPVSPTEGQTFTENNTVWIYSAVTGQWNRSVINPLNETLYEFGGSATATGNAGEIQYTDGTNLAASPNLVWDNVNNELEIEGDIVLDDGIAGFTTTLQTITPTAARTISFPDATGTVALVGGSSGQLVYNNAGAQAGAPGSVVGATGDVTLGLNGAASTPPLDITGTWFTGGTSTTTKPQVLIEPAGTTSTSWSTSGTGLGVNATSGFTGRLLDLQTNGTSRVIVTGAGRMGLGTDDLLSVLTLRGTANNWAASFGATMNQGEYTGISLGFGPGSQYHKAAIGFIRTDTTNGAGDLVFCLGSTANTTNVAIGDAKMRVKSTGVVNFSALPTYADNAAATTGGLVAGDVYKTATGELRITV